MVKESFLKSKYEMKYLITIISLSLLFSCVQDSPNIKQIENLQFFIDNKESTDVIEVEKGLQYSIIKNGNPDGAQPTLDQVITAHFHGTLTNGDVFWTSLDTEPLSIELGGLIEGCQKLISLMREGDKWRVFIDPTMAYGEEGRPGIPSNSILIFEIELLEIES